MTVGIIMGSKSDWPTMEHAALMLEKFGIEYETKVVSAHRTPQLLADYANSAADRGNSDRSPLIFDNETADTVGVSHA